MSLDHTANSSTPVNDAARSQAIRLLVTSTLLFTILGIGAYFRLLGQDWDNSQHLHPDERFLSLVEGAISPVDSLGEYFDTNASSLNPNNVGYGFFVYGNFPITFVRYLSEANETAGYNYVHLTGRAVSAASDLLSILLIFFIGRSLFDYRVGLLASALYAFAALPIQLSHFFTVDSFTNLFVVAAFYIMARAVKKHTWIDYPLFGLMLGLAMASKISVYLLALVFTIALVVRTWLETLPDERAEEGQDVPEEERPPFFQRPFIRSALPTAAGLAIAGLVTLIVFRVAQPYAFLPPGSNDPIVTEEIGLPMSIVSTVGNPIGLRPNPLWLQQMDEVRRQVSGYADIPPNHQWGKRIPILFPVSNIVRVGLGWPVGLFAWLSFFWALWEIRRGSRQAAHLMILVVWVGLIMVWQGIGWVTTMRYFLPIYPFLLMLAAWALITIWDRVQNLIIIRHAPRSHWSARLATVFIAGILLSGLLWGYAVSRIYTRPVTRVEASLWMIDNIPSDVTLFLSTDDGPRSHHIGLPNIWREPDSPIEEDPTEPQVEYTLISPGLAQPYQFSLPYDATITGMRLNHVLDPMHRAGLETVRVFIADNLSGENPIAEGQVVSDFEVDGDPRGESYAIALGDAQIRGNQSYYLFLEADEAGPLILAGSSVATEGAWDDPLPLSLAGVNVWGAQYQGYELQIHWEDVDTKRDRMQYVLDRADYLVISSNRFYDSLRRNPQRYPMTLAYYQALFTGNLGFELVGDFTSHPNLGPIEFSDDTAEEAWTVYDHPRVLIFKKTADYSSAEVAAVLGSVDLETTVRAIAKDSVGRPQRLPDPSQALPQAGTDGPQNIFLRFHLLAVIVWWLAMLIIGWVAFPILWWLFPGLPDRGYPASKIFGLLIVSWLAWMAASTGILKWGTVGVLIAIMVLAGAALWIVLRNRDQFRVWLSDNRRHIIFIESLTFALFGLFLLIRLGNSDLWHPAFGGEKPMDLSYFNAILRSDTFPPYDPWFAGGTINYYYFGFVLVGAPVVLINIPTTLAYNLILPTLFALTGITTFSAAFNLVRTPDSDSTTTPPTGSRPDRQGFFKTLRQWPEVSFGELSEAARSALDRITGNIPQPSAYIAGFAAMLMAVILGNLDQIRTVIWALAELGSGQAAFTSTLLPNMGDTVRGLVQSFGKNQPLPIGLGEWYWNATRLIPVPINEAGQPTEIGPITEFPFFTFLYADLHAHMIAMPLALLALTWIIAQVRSASTKISTLVVVANIVIGALIVGSLRPTNTWDLPTYLLLGMLALTLATIARRDDSLALNALTAGGGVAVLSVIVAYLVLASDLVVTGIAGLLGLILGFALWLLITNIRRHNPEAATDVNPDTSQIVHALLTLGISGVQAAALTILTAILFLPFLQNYELGYNNAIPWAGSRTPLWAYLDILGLFLFIILTWLVWESWQWIKSARTSGAKLSRRTIVPAFVAVILVLGLIGQIAANSYPVALLSIPLALWAGVLFVRPNQPMIKRLSLLVLIIALALTLAVETVVLEGDIGRMNTVFKFYVQVWLLMALVAGAAFGWLWKPLKNLAYGLRLTWVTVLIILVFLAGLYPLLATRAKVADRWAPDAPHTLDGMTYMAYAERYENGVSFPLRPDYEALRWMQAEIEDNPVVLEANTIEYQWGNRVAVYTGLPSLIGWNWHQRQQRPNNHDEIWERVSVVREVYNTTDITYTLDVIERYDIGLIMVGELERAYYNAAGLQKFDRMVDDGYLRLLYDRDNTRIYEVIGS